jgi:hypothetical protein
MRRRDNDPPTGEVLARRLAEEQLENTRHVQRTANVILRLAGLVLLGGMIAGVALMVQKNSLCDSADTSEMASSLCDQDKYPYFGDGLALLVGSLVSGFWMALGAQWARTYATAQLIIATEILARGHPS